MAAQRLEILTPDEIEELYGVPNFTDKERSVYFCLDDDEKKHMKLCGSIESRVHFILQLGYFKCRSLFFNITFAQMRDDVSYIMQQYFPHMKTPQVMLKDLTQMKNQTKILRLLGFKWFDKKVYEILEHQAEASLKICANARYVMDDLLNILDKNHIVIPGYTTLQNIISHAYLKETARLSNIIATNIPPSVDELFQELLKTRSDVTIEHMYGVTLLKKDAKGFNYKEMMSEIEKKNTNQFCMILPKVVSKNLRYLNKTYIITPV